MPLTDEDLLRQVATGGREAFVALYDRYAPRVFGLLLKLLPSRTEAEDVLQEVMWEIWRKADRYDPAIGSAQTWILLTARSRAIDAVRRLRRTGELTKAVGNERRAQLEAGIAETHSVGGGSKSAKGGGREMDAKESVIAEGGEKLAGALSHLPDEQQTAIRLAFVHGLTRQEIAEATGVPIGTVKTRISLGVRKLNEAAAKGSEGVSS
jgi:RNA polymerase sigma-70 factor, ECF subfamily